MASEPAAERELAAIAHRTRASSMVHTVAIGLFGLVLPVLILFQAYLGITTLHRQVTAELKAGGAVHTLTALGPRLNTGNDYAIASVLAAERTNLVVVTNKQIMKITIIEVGFAVISLGLMLILLGVNDGGVTGKMGLGDVSFDMKTGSTGVLVFVVGAAMVTAGGALKNDYKTVPIPEYVHDGMTPKAQARAIVQYCSAQEPNGYEACVSKALTASAK